MGLDYNDLDAVVAFSKEMIMRPEAVKASVMGFLKEKCEADHLPEDMGPDALRPVILLLMHTYAIGIKEISSVMAPACWTETIMEHDAFAGFRLVLMHLTDLVLGRHEGVRAQSYAGSGKQDADMDVLEQVSSDNLGLIKQQHDDIKEAQRRFKSMND